jgi:hypothetical protein
MWLVMTWKLVGGGRRTTDRTVSALGSDTISSDCCGDRICCTIALKVGPPISKYARPSMFVGP